jgi:hypothetical protein
VACVHAPYNLVLHSRLERGPLPAPGVHLRPVCALSAAFHGTDRTGPAQGPLRKQAPHTVHERSVAGVLTRGLSSALHVRGKTLSRSRAARTWYRVSGAGAWRSHNRSAASKSLR